MQESNQVNEEKKEGLNTSDISNNGNTSENFKMEAQVIGQLAQEKQQGMFGTMFFFILLIAFAIGLPYITDFVKEKTGKSEETNVSEPIAPKEEKQEETKEAEEVLYYDINPNVEFSFEELKLSEFSKELKDDYYLNFKVYNNSDEIFKFNKNYYLELYNDSKTLLERVKLVSNSSVNSNSTEQLSLLISEDSYNNATLVSITKKTGVDYPEITLEAKEEDFDVLTCTNKSQEIKYYFKDNSLEKISDVLNYTNENSDEFNNELRFNTSVAASYSNIKGVTSSVAGTYPTFTMNTLIDLNDADISQLNNYLYYKKGSLPKSVKFDLETMRYSCK